VPTWGVESTKPHRLPERNSNPLTAFFVPITPIGGKIDMIKHLPPPTAADEYRNTAEILRDLAAQVRFGKTRNELVNLADNLDRLAAHAERQICGALELSLSPAASALDSDEPQRQHAWRKFPE